MHDPESVYGGLACPHPLTAGTTYQFYVKAKDSTGQSGPASGTVSVTTTTSQPPPSSAKVTYNVVSDWGDGFTTNITITNTGTTTINHWTLAFTFPGNQHVSNGWSANWSQTGNAVTATDAGYNATITPGSSVQIGFTGTYTGSNPKPTAFTVNGQSATAG